MWNTSKMIPTRGERFSPCRAIYDSVDDSDSEDNAIEVLNEMMNCSPSMRVSPAFVTSLTRATIFRTSSRAPKYSASFSTTSLKTMHSSSLTNTIYKSWGQLWDAKCQLAGCPLRIIASIKMQNKARLNRN